MKIKFITLYLIIVLMGILSLTGCKTSEETDVYDIRGKWMLIIWNPGSDATNGFAGEIVFSGSETDGTAVGIFSLEVMPGTYSVNIKQVTITINSNLFAGVFTITGTFTDPDHITGTWEVNNNTGLLDLRR